MRISDWSSDVCSSDLSGYPGQKAWSITVGMQYAVFSNITAGIFVTNPNKASFVEEIKEALPVTAAMGIAWAFSQKVLGVAGLKRVSGIPLSVHCGLEYLPHHSLAVRVGASSAPFRHYGGLGLMWGPFRLDMAISSTLQLGFTPQISMA